jgi:hypothetical protein
MYVPEGEVATAESPKVEAPHDPEADYCEYLGKKHKVLSFDKENNTYELEMVSTGRIRKGVEADKVVMS